MARQEDQTPPETRLETLPGGCEAGARLAGEARRSFPPQECRHWEEPPEGESLPEEPRDFRGSCTGRTAGFLERFRYYLGLLSRTDIVICSLTNVVIHETACVYV